MDASHISLPPELRTALDAQGGQPLQVWDDESQKLYLIIEEASLRPIDDDFLREALREADEDIAQGRVGPWDVEEIKREGRRILAERQARRDQ
jgi:hypothetical protein